MPEFIAHWANDCQGKGCKDFYPLSPLACLSVSYRLQGGFFIPVVSAGVVAVVFISI